MTKAPYLDRSLFILPCLKSLGCERLTRELWNNKKGYVTILQKNSLSGIGTGNCMLYWGVLKPYFGGMIVDVMDTASNSLEDSNSSDSLLEVLAPTGEETDVEVATVPTAIATESAPPVESAKVAQTTKKSRMLSREKLIAQITRAQNRFAEQLNETELIAIYQIRQIIIHFQIKVAREILQEALEIEANGGLMTRDGSRRRTVGGVFFQTAFDRMGKQKAFEIKGRTAYFADLGKLAQKINPLAAKPSIPEPSTPSLAWEDRLPVLALLFEKMGEVTTVKITLIGRPGQVEVRGNMVVTAMKHEAKPVPLPSGLPTLPQTTTAYTVYISKKQWKKVEGDLAADPEDKLIVEGVGVLDAEAKSLALFATGVKSLSAEKKKHPPKSANAAPSEAASPVIEAPVAPPPPPPRPTKPERASRFTEDIAAVPTVLPVVEAALPTNMPPDVAEKLMGLRATEQAYRQKVEALESKPEGQRFGLDMTRKLLKKVEDDIATLEQQYR
jgi:hypothetical protein